MRKMSTAAMFTPHRNQMIPKISQRLDLIRKKVKPSQIFSMKEKIRLETSQEKLSDFKDKI